VTPRDCCPISGVHFTELINDAKLLFNEYANQGAMIIRDTVLNGFDISQVGKKEQSEVARSIVQYLLKEKDATPF
jgi:hypothetical protein